MTSKGCSPRAIEFRGACSGLTIADSQELFDYFSINFGATDVDCRSLLNGHLTLRSIRCGELTLGYSNAASTFRIPSARLPKLTFTFNAWGDALFRVDCESLSPLAGKGLLLATPGEETEELDYVRSQGEGNFITVDAASLLRVAKAMNGPLAMNLLRERLNKPLHYTPFEAAAGASYARSVTHSLRLVEDLLVSAEPLPQALCLDDLIQRQLVLMLCPELALDALPGHEQGSEQRFSLLLEWLRAHRHEPISLTEMEQHSGYSRRTLQKKFQARFSCGPMQWLRRSRLELALEQLQRPQPSDSVTSIARRCGYINLASFSRDFSAAYGRRPSELLSASLKL